MPSLPSDQPYNMVWRLHCDTQKREYKLTVEYYSNLPPDKHEDVHRKLSQKAFQWLVARGYPAENSEVQVVFRRLECDPLPAPPDPVPVPPDPVPVPIAEEEDISDSLRAQVSESSDA